MFVSNPVRRGSTLLVVLGLLACSEDAMVPVESGIDPVRNDSGGSVAMGGTVLSGGTLASGGDLVSGGLTVTGGMVTTGGDLATGGMDASGGAVGTGGGTEQGVCGGDTPHGCFTPQASNTADCPPQIPEQTEGFVVPLNEWVPCGVPGNVCNYDKPQGGVANCFCDTGVHWICTYGL